MARSDGSKNKMSAKIKALLFFTLMFLLVPLATGLMYLFRSHHRMIRRNLANLFINLFRIKVDEQGTLDPEARILILNHRSFLDVIYFEGTHPGDLCWIAKKQLGDVPILGHALKAPKMLLIDREDKRGLISLLKKAQEKKQDNRILAIFPEGTRSRGEKMLKFKPGAKVIAEKLQVKVQPIVLLNTKEVFDTQSLSLTSKTAKAIYLDSFLPEKGSDWYDKLREHMQNVYDEEMRKPDEEMKQ